MTDKIILDACCGSRMFWWNKRHPAVVYNDIRELKTTLCDGRTLEVSPDTFYDFRDLPYPSVSFKMVVFDPPHLIKAGANSWLATKYGLLS
ncbi:SAM-dependent methyltransferase, partial [Eubacterium callanderi]|nr:SAM-dependent methyltransferase [Eubacterium callanderi]